MIITCDNCNSRFNIKDELIKPQGSKVKCAKCQNIFKVYPPAAAVSEESGVDIEKDFAPQGSAVGQAPVFEEPDVAPGISEDAKPKRSARRMPARSAALGAAAAPAAAEAEAEAAAEAVEPPPVQEWTPQTTRSEGFAAPLEDAGESDAFAGFGDEDDDDEMFDRADREHMKATKGKKGGSSASKILLLLIVIIILLLILGAVLPRYGMNVPVVGDLAEKAGITKLVDKILPGGAKQPVVQEPVATLPQRPAQTEQPVVAPQPEQPAQPAQPAQPEPQVVADQYGIDKFYMDEKMVNAGILGNTSSGIVIIVEGLLQNNYDTPRKALKVVGRLYNEQSVVEQETFVYAGNLLTEEELMTFTPEEIEERLFNTGRDISVPAGGTIPFMVVFTNIPEPVSTYSYECVLLSSEASNK